MRTVSVRDLRRLSPAGRAARSDTTVGPALATRAAASRRSGGHDRDLGVAASAALWAWRTISLSPSFGAWTTVTCPSRPAVRRPSPRPEHQDDVAVEVCGDQLLVQPAGGAGAVLPPSVRPCAPTTLAPSTTRTFIAGSRGSRREKSRTPLSRRNHRQQHGDATPGPRLRQRTRPVTEPFSRSADGREDDEPSDTTQ